MCLLQIVIVLLLPFQFGCLLFLFSPLITLGRISNIILSKNDESWYPCLVLDLKGKAITFSYRV